jgi:uncharacterized protein YlaI
MVERIEKAFNRPICKIHATPLFWMRELRTSNWDCHRCHKRSGPGSITFEVTVRFASKISDWKKDELTGRDVKEDKWVEKPVKHYLCLDCAHALLTEALEKLDLVRAHGSEAFRLFEEL